MAPQCIAEIDAKHVRKRERHKESRRETGRGRNFPEDLTTLHTSAGSIIRSCRRVARKKATQRTPFLSLSHPSLSTILSPWLQIALKRDESDHYNCLCGRGNLPQGGHFGPDWTVAGQARPLSAPKLFDTRIQQKVS